MNALALHPTPAGEAPSLACRPDLTRIGQVLLAIEDMHAAGDTLDGRIHEAMGWEVLRAHGRTLGVRRPGARQWQRMGRPSRCEGDAARLVPFRWDWGCGMRGGLGVAWCRDTAPPPGATPFFSEASRRTPAMALVVAALFGQRHLLLQEMTPPAPPALACDCGWSGPAEALRVSGCPDCQRRILPALRREGG